MDIDLRIETFNVVCTNTKKTGKTLCIDWSTFGILSIKFIH